MTTRKFVVGICFLTASAMAQGPLNDRIEVNLPYPVTVNHTVLQPGEYVIRQHEDAGGGSRILHFFSDNGMKLETTAMAIPALDNNTPEHTKLVLDHVGDDYYLNKIWVQGKNYGYEFPLPPSIRMREEERNKPATVAAHYEPTPAPNTAQSQTSNTETESRPQTEIAQVVTPPAPPAPAPEPPPVPIIRQQADTQTPATPAMPATAANWLNLVLGGLLLSGSGFALRRARI